jgi:hypothetical protein
MYPGWLYAGHGTFIGTGGGAIGGCIASLHPRRSSFSYPFPVFEQTAEPSGTPSYPDPASHFSDVHFVAPPFPTIHLTTNPVFRYGGHSDGSTGMSIGTGFGIGAAPHGGDMHPLNLPVRRLFTQRVEPPGAPDQPCQHVIGVQGSDVPTGHDDVVVVYPGCSYGLVQSAGSSTVMFGSIGAPITGTGCGTIGSWQPLRSSWSYPFVPEHFALPAGVPTNGGTHRSPVHVTTPPAPAMHFTTYPGLP